MLQSDMNVAYGLLNGTRLIVQNMLHTDVYVLGFKVIGVITGVVDESSADSALPFSFKRSQYPIRLAFCRTTNNVTGHGWDLFNQVRVQL